MEFKIKRRKEKSLEWSGVLFLCDYLAKNSHSEDMGDTGLTGNESYDLITYYWKTTAGNISQKFEVKKINTSATMKKFAGLISVDFGRIGFMEKKKNSYRKIYSKAVDDGLYPYFRIFDNQDCIGIEIEINTHPFLPYRISSEHLRDTEYDPNHSCNKPYWDIERIVYDDSNGEISKGQIESLREYIRSAFRQKKYAIVTENNDLIDKNLGHIEKRMLQYSKKCSY